jgi:t-SNARE complex subunit (syntaxin)
LFGLFKAKKVLLAQKRINDWKNLKRNLDDHAHNTEHLQAEISRGLFSKNDRIDLKLLHSNHQKISENREILLAIINVLLF